MSEIELRNYLIRRMEEDPSFAEALRQVDSAEQLLSVMLRMEPEELDETMLAKVCGGMTLQNLYEALKLYL